MRFSDLVASSLASLRCAFRTTLTVLGLTARVEFDADDGILWGKVLGLPDQVSITFEGQTVQELRQDFERAVDFTGRMRPHRRRAAQTRQRQT